MAEVGMITIRELLRDPQFKAYFIKVPELPSHYSLEGALPWRLLVMKKGENRWRGKNFETYKDAFLGFKKMLPLAHDAAINCRGINFMPPVKTVRLKGRVDAKGKPILRTLVWKPQLELDMVKHEWCAYCRRPSVFVNKALPSYKSPTTGFTMPVSNIAYRCSICGTSADLMDIRKPELNQRWDTHRPRVYSG